MVLVKDRYIYYEKSDEHFFGGSNTFISSRIKYFTVSSSYFDNSKVPDVSEYNIDVIFLSVLEIQPTRVKLPFRFSRCALIIYTSIIVTSATTLLLLFDLVTFHFFWKLVERKK